MIFIMAESGFIWDYMALSLMILLSFGSTYGITNCHFENSYGCTGSLRGEHDAIEGWRVHRDRTNSFAFVSCQSSCTKQVTLMRGLQSMQPSKFTANFCYYLSTIDGGVDVQLRVLACGKNKTVALTKGGWQSTSVRLTCHEPFEVGFEVSFSSGLQRVALDQVTVRDSTSKFVSTVCSDVEPSLFDLYPAIIETPITVSTGGYAADYVGNEAETAVYSDQFYPASESIPPILTEESSSSVLESEGIATALLPNEPFASEKTTPSNTKPGQKFFNDVVELFQELLSNPLLLAEVLAIATVAICCMTITIHCFIWRKQRQSYQLYNEKHYRAQRYLARDLSNSDMLLNMTVHDSCSDSDFGPISRSRSSSKATPLVDRAKLKASKPLSDRRATVLLVNGYNSGNDSGDETKPRPHPRTKSLPSRPPINYYETIDEVRKNALQPVHEGDGDQSKSRSLPTLVESQRKKTSETQKSRRSAKSCKDKSCKDKPCKDKRDRKCKKHKRQSRKRSKNEINVKENVVINVGKEIRESVYENGNVKRSDGDYTKLDRDCQTQTPSEIICDLSVTENGKKRTERFSLHVDSRGSQSSKKQQFRQRAFSDKLGKDKNAPDPSLVNQNVKLADGVSDDLNNKSDVKEEKPYFTLEPLEQSQNQVNHTKNSELPDINGSVDTLQEQDIISKNQTDSFKRSVNKDQKVNRSDSSATDSNAYETYEIGAYDNFRPLNQLPEKELSALKLGLPKNGLFEKDMCSKEASFESSIESSTISEICNNKNDDTLSTRTYQTLEPGPIQSDSNTYQSLEPDTTSTISSSGIYQTLEPPVEAVPKRRKSEETFF